MKLITVFTPTYNRAYILERCYVSLCNQTNKSFIWLIVDDGSTDNTRDIVKKWIDERKIDIRYIYQKNMGKMAAHNNAIKNTETKFFVCLDSDDFMVENAIELMCNEWEKIYIDKNISAVISPKKDLKGNMLTTKLPPIKSRISTFKQWKKKYNYTGEMFICYRSEILLKNLFPIIEGEKFISEAYLYIQLDEIYNMYLVYEPLCICEYLEDGYTNNVIENILNNPKGYSMMCQVRLKYSDGLIDKIINQIKCTISFIIADKSNIKNDINNKFLYIITYPIAILIYTIIFKRTERKKNGE